MPKRVYTRAYASVRFAGETLDPLTITLALRLPPDCAVRAGEPRLTRTKSGKVMEYAPYPLGLWSMSSEPWVKSPRLAVHIDWLLSQLEPKADIIKSLLSGEIEADIFCLSSGSNPAPPSLPRSIRARAQALGLSIEINHYANGGATP